MTSAAVVMVAVFSIFATLSMADYKMLGVGMAVAVLIDATLVRGILLPSALALLGERAWTLPGWLAWVPSLSVEGEAEAEEEPVPDAAPEYDLAVLETQYEPVRELGRV